MRYDLMLADDRLADAVDDLIDRDAFALGALDFLDDDEFLRRIAIADGECRTAMPPQCRMAALHGILDVLRIVVGAADDHDLLDPAGDEQLAGRVEKAEIAGAQPVPVRLTGGPHPSLPRPLPDPPPQAGEVGVGARRGRVREGAGAESRFAGFGVMPMAAGDIGAGDPDLADPVGAETRSAVGIDDRDALAGEGAAAADRHLLVAGI